MAFSKLTKPVGTDRRDQRNGLHTQKSVLFNYHTAKVHTCLPKEDIAICSASHEVLTFLTRLHVIEEKLQHKKPLPWVRG